MERTVLVVDDLEFVRKTLIEILTKNHFQVVGEAKTGKEAIDLYQSLKPEVVTMDIVMPELGGIEATKLITKMDKSAKVVMISAMGQENMIMEAINAGAKDFILKPFTEDEIVKTIEHVLSGSEQMAKKAARL